MRGKKIKSVADHGQYLLLALRMFIADTLGLISSHGTSSGGRNVMKLKNFDSGPKDLRSYVKVYLCSKNIKHSNFFTTKHMIFF